ncbi:MAG TPA: PhzF family phenazine biosynthesis protein [Burkholderiaceae bacterium]|nr:PhzF family phenazine biosynthesis protein [Burkholderiaceae bacterium]
MSTPRTRRFRQLDVFTDRPLLGNPLAVVIDGEGLSEAQMASFARWTNLSETTFLLPPTEPAADYRVRIFTPTVELPFAGHPTLGSCHAWLAAGGRSREHGVVVQQCGVGLVRIRRDGTRLAFAAPPRRRQGPLDEDEVMRVARFLQVPREAIVAHQHCDNGPGWKAVMLASAEAVRACRPLLGSESDFEVGVVGPTLVPGKVGVVGPEAATGSADAPAFEVRAFFPAAGGGLAEDPVTGSLNAALAQWLIESGRAPSRYVAAQGTALGRAGRVHVRQEGDTVWIGGDVAACIDGTLAL